MEYSLHHSLHQIAATRDRKFAPYFGWHFHNRGKEATLENWHFREFSDFVANQGHFDVDLGTVGRPHKLFFHFEEKTLSLFGV